jgi:hypothetical protein
MMDEHDEENLGLTSMPLRLYTCPACSRPIAMTFRPDVAHRSVPPGNAVTRAEPTAVALRHQSF